MTLEKIKQLQQLNNHTEARIQIAKLYKLKSFEKVFKAIKDIQEIEGSLDYNLSMYRAKRTDEMMQAIIGNIVGEEEAKKIYQVL